MGWGYWCDWRAANVQEALVNENIPLATLYRDKSIFLWRGIVSPRIWKSQCSQTLLNPALCNINIVRGNNWIKLPIKCDCSAGLHCKFPKNDEDKARIQMLMCIKYCVHCWLWTNNLLLPAPTSLVWMGITLWLLPPWRTWLPQYLNEIRSIITKYLLCCNIHHFYLLYKPWNYIIIEEKSMVCNLVDIVD